MEAVKETSVAKSYLIHPRLYRIYSGMIDRCHNNKNPNFHNYGGRGIAVCLQWIRNRESFIEWALENGYKDSLTIDRINVNDGYRPDNCRWATVQEQAQNKRTSKFYTYKGERKTLSDWCRCLQLDYDVVKRRINAGWEPEEAFDESIFHQSSTTIFNGKEITQIERFRLIRTYREILNAHYEFFECPPSPVTREQKIKEVKEELDQMVCFYEFDADKVERLLSVSN